MLRNLQILINAAARMVVEIPRFLRERITPIFIDLRILPIKTRIIHKICLLTYKTFKYGQPSYFVEFLGYRPLTTINIRFNNNNEILLEPIVSHQILSNRCFIFCSPHLYNSFPLHLRHAENVNIFKLNLKTFIFSVTYDLQNGIVS